MITVHNRSQPLRGYSLDLADVRSLLRTLRELGAESRTRELQKIQSRQDLPADQKASIEKAIRDTDPVWISIYGTRGEHLFLGAAPDFLDEQLPKEIGSIFVSNLNPYRKVFNREPDLALELELDFADPLILDWQNPASGPTQNSSYILANISSRRVIRSGPVLSSRQ